jgi:hypothetical protein
VCATCVIPSFDLDLAIWRDDKPVSGASRYIPLATADDKQVITDESEFDPMPVEELKDLRIVVLVHLDPRDDFHCWPSSVGERSDPPNSVLPDAPDEQRELSRRFCVVARAVATTHSIICSR